MSEEYKVKQLNPNHADHITGYNSKWLQQMYDNDAIIAQPIYDGERMLIHINHGEVYCTSRRFSKKTNRYMENQDKLPVLQEACKHLTNLDYTVIDCECFSKDWSTIVGILHSLPERAIELQKLNSAKFAVFDCLYFNGLDVRDDEYHERLNLMIKVVNMINYHNLFSVEFMNQYHKPDDMIHAGLIHSDKDWQECMQNAIDAGYEGVVIKSLNKTYYDKGASLKCKKFETVDVVVIDYKPGTGKYTDTIGALVVGYYDQDTNSFVRLSNVNCSTDEERQYWHDNWTTLLHTVIEVKCQEITEKSLRHPVYIRRRDDKDYTMCTKDTIFKGV